MTASAIHAGPASTAAAAFGTDDAADALKRMQCPLALKDKDGKAAGGICFDGKN